MKKAFILFMLTILMGCSNINFDQDKYFNELVTNKGFTPFPHSENLRYLRKHVSLFEYADFLIIPATSENIDKIYENNIKDFTDSTYQILVQEKNYTELMNPLKIKAIIYKDRDCVIIVTGNSPDYAAIVTDLKK